MSDFTTNLTAYALGELDGDQEAPARAEVEAALATDPQATAFVEAVRATASTLTTSLASEASPGLDSDRIEALLAVADPGPARPLRLSASERADAGGAGAVMAESGSAPTSLYHVIHHPAAEPRHWRRTLFAVAASVAIVASAVTAVLSSALRRTTPGPTARIPADPSPVPPSIVFVPGNSADATDHSPLPGMSETVPWIAKSPHDLLPDPEARDHAPLFGIGPVVVIPLHNRPPTTNPAGGDNSAYAVNVENPFVQVSASPVTGMPLRAGRASYAAVRRSLESGHLPAKDDVRIEELVNYFPYHDTAPVNGDAVAAHLEASACPWEQSHRLVRLGLKTRDGVADEIVARETRVQIEFNPAAVAAYRLVGFDRRLSTRDDESGAPSRNLPANYAVTALYEIIPAKADSIAQPANALKYQTGGQLTAAARSRDLLTVTLRYQDGRAGAANGVADRTGAITREFTATDAGGSCATASVDFRFAAAAASFGLILRDSPHKGTATFDTVLTLATPGLAVDELGARAEFIQMVKRAKALRV